MKKTTILFCFFLLSVNSFAQSNITNTLGTGGVFSIKDASNDYFTVNQSTGEINILNSLRLQETFNSSTTGVIFKGGSRFIHNFWPTGAPGYNMFIGSNAGNFTMTHTGGDDASYNTGVGNGSLLSLTTGNSNTALGYSALVSNTTGFSNTAVGSNSLSSNTTGDGNVAIGDGALSENTTGFRNIAMGYGSLASNTTGYSNTATGWFSLITNTIGAENIAYGNQALQLNSTGNANTAVGYYSLRLNVAGINNTAVGHHSLENNNGNYNTALGYNAGSTVTTGANLTLLGIDANPSSPTSIDQITLGNSFVSSLRCNVQNISSLSDARDKQNIKELDLGIDFLMKIKPRLFNWDKRERK